MSTKYLASTNTVNRATDLRVYDLTIDDRLFSEVTDVVQNTSKTTSVTCNSLTGRVFTVALTDAANTAFSFNILNTKVAQGDVVIATIERYTGTWITHGMPSIAVTGVVDGTITVTVYNAAPANLLAGSLIIGFVIHSAI